MFSKANSKTDALKQVEELQVWLEEYPEVYSFDLLSGWSCPYARDCFAKVVINDAGKREVVDGEFTEFRCFSASQEVQYPATYEKRKRNFDTMKAAKTTDAMFKILNDNLPKKAGIIRIHVAGDFFNQNYFDAWVRMAEEHPDRLFYFYTKALPFWLEYDYLTDNMVGTASRGGRCDDLIDQYGLREAIVVADPAIVDTILESGDHNNYNGLAIDHDDSHAAVPEWKDDSFYLLIHGTQPAGSDAGQAKSKLKGLGSYGKKSNV